MSDPSPSPPQAAAPQAHASDASASEAKAAGSSFYAGMRILPKPEREAMFAVYGFCRIVDDIADEETAPKAARREEMAAWRQSLFDLYAGRPAPSAAFLETPIKRFGLRLDDFLAVIDGMQMDLDGPICAPDVETLDLYCDRVASAVGRLSVRIFGMGEAEGVELAHHLGRALQLTNILRDLDEDADLGRLYMAREWLEAAGAPTHAPRAAIDHPGFDQAARRAADLARAHYAGADLVLRRRPKGHLAAPRLMSAVYRARLTAMEAQGWAPPRRPARLSKARLLWTVVRGAAGL